MVFDSLKASFNFRRSRRTSTALSDVPFVRYEDLPQTSPTPPLKQDRSLKAVLLPGIPSFKPLTISNFLAIGKPPTDSMSTTAERTATGSSTSPSQPNNVQPVNLGSSQPKRTINIPRKPVGLPDDPRRASYVSSFDPQAPRKDPTLHYYARKVLLRRYQSKFTLPADFIRHCSATTANVDEYKFLWVKPGEVEKKVLEDIIWVRERFAYARMDEPTDCDLIRWYNAELFDDESEAGAMDRASIEVNLGEEST